MKRTLRFRILKRDGFACRYCGAKGNGVRLEVDHVHPRSRGGSDHPNNLVTACFDCNRGKRDREPKWCPCTRLLPVLDQSEFDSMGYAGDFAPALIKMGPWCPPSWANEETNPDSYDAWLATVEDLCGDGTGQWPCVLEDR